MLITDDPPSGHQSHGWKMHHLSCSLIFPCHVWWHRSGFFRLTNRNWDWEPIQWKWEIPDMMEIHRKTGIFFFCGISMISTNKNLGVSIWKSWEPFLKIHPLVLIFPMIWWPQFLAKAGEILVGICFLFFDAPLLRYAMKKKGFWPTPPSSEPSRD